ncbi:MAG: GntR family transcriptional regulator [Clostridia bacterium]|nr:GntR family transcriptional regulator [Clostridia bacterium]
MGNLKVSNEPIYVKVYEFFKNQILNGILKPNDKLPSVRELATKFIVNPNTIQRALSELEREGLIYSVVGKGNFVADAINSAKQNEISDIYKLINNHIEKLQSLGISKKEIFEQLKKNGGND